MRKLLFVGIFNIICFAAFSYSPIDINGTYQNIKNKKVFEIKDFKIPDGFKITYYSQ